MPQIERSALVLHTPVEMYQLVQDVNAYPQFLSWCEDAKVVEQDEAEQLAVLTVRFGRMKQSFSTRNQLIAGERLVMSLVDGPFRYLSGDWKFNPIGDMGCKVLLSLNFEFKHSVLSMAFERGFSKVADRLVREFCLRAEKVYG